MTGFLIAILTSKVLDTPTSKILGTKPFPTLFVHNSTRVLWIPNIVWLTQFFFVRSQTSISIYEHGLAS